VRVNEVVALRKRAGLSHVELARRAGLGNRQGDISRWENGELGVLSNEAISRIGEVLRLELSTWLKNVAHAA